MHPKVLNLFLIVFNCNLEIIRAVDYNLYGAILTIQGQPLPKHVVPNKYYLNEWNQGRFLKPMRSSPHCLQWVTEFEFNFRQNKLAFGL